MTSDEKLLIDHRDDGIVVVTMNRPEAYNAVDEDLHEAISSVWLRLASVEDLRAVVLTGAGEAFTAGGDLSLLERMAVDPALRAHIIAEGASLVRSLVSFPVPIVAAVNGAAVGLGCSLASLSDLVVMEDHAYLADPHVALGLVAGDGGALTWPLNMGLQRVKEWLLLGGRISANQAFDIGLANRVVARGEALAEGVKLAKRLANLPPQALNETRRFLNQPMNALVESTLDDLLAAETASFDEPAFQSNLAAMARRRRA
ncbi:MULTISPECIES: enoyl-CoA hydratase/isomerase family protein [unclassified Mycobacterium]|uniref:enoyl-CoA hydratase/isomerase family protein n=1 Tax=unclassified Mycobacterium TaxID=2642494 RepID=UPI0029C7F094|nr:MULTISPECIES: enoyl-CoA hydratase/isomerase family protein [unclassified Mycobacterium]